MLRCLSDTRITSATILTCAVKVRSLVSKERNINQSGQATARVNFGRGDYCSVGHYLGEVMTVEEAEQEAKLRRDIARTLPKQSQQHRAPLL